MRKAVRGEKESNVRLFIAAELPDNMLEALAETSALLRESVHGNYVAPDSFHVTLVFLGSVPGSQLNGVTDALEAGCAGFDAFEASLGSLGSFGKRTAATLWQGFEDAGEMPRIARALRAELAARGFAYDDKNFLAHITLMRKANIASGMLPSPSRVTGIIRAITLFASDLSGARPVYEPLHTVELE